MKIASNNTGLYLRLGAVAAALLFGQQALAEGTRAGTVVENTASVDYQVNAIDQTAVSSNTVSFQVDRRVDFVWTLASTPDLEPVTPGGSDYFVDFVLTNTSNSDLDFDLVLAQTANGVLIDNTGNDDADLATVDYAISGNTVAGGDPDPVRGVNTGIIDDLPADAAIRVRVYGDAALTMLDGEVAGVELTATAFEPGTAGLGAALTYGGPNTDAVENVDVDDLAGVRIAIDGFIVEAAALAATKAYSVVSDPLNSGLVVPGAVVEYTITIVNSGGTAASNVSVTDTLDGDVTFLGGQYAGNDIEIDNGGVVTQCSADAAGADTDGCSLDGVSLVVGNANGPISIAAGATLVVSFQVEIPDPATTP